jgi:hypothetical protein
MGNKTQVIRKGGLAAFSLVVGYIGLSQIDTGNTNLGFGLVCVAIAGLIIRELTKSLDTKE